jgi:hypothetical protein
MNMRQDCQGWYNSETFQLVTLLTNDARLYGLALKALTPYGLPVNKSSFRDGLKALAHAEGLTVDLYRVKWNEVHAHFLTLIGR